MNAWPLDEGLIDYVDPSYGGATDENPYAILDVIANPSFTLSGGTVDATEITPGASGGHAAGGRRHREPTSRPATTRSSSCSGARISTAPAPAPATAPGPTTPRATPAPTATATVAGRTCKAATDLLVSDLDWMAGQWADGGDARTDVTGEPDSGHRRHPHRHGQPLLRRAGRRADAARPDAARPRGGARLLLRQHLQQPLLRRHGRAERLSRALRPRSTAASSRGRRSPTWWPRADPALDTDLRAALDHTMAALAAIKTVGEAGTHYDQLLATGNDAGEALVMAGDRRPVAQTRSIERAVSALKLAHDRLRGLRQPRQPRRGLPVGDRDAPPRSSPCALLAGRRARPAPPVGALPTWSPRTPDEAARIEAVTAPDHRFRRARAVRGAARRRRDLRRAARRQRLLAFLGATCRFERELDFKVGNGFFRKLWVTAPSSTTSPPTASGRSTTPAPASPATSRTAAATRRPARTTRRSRCSCRLSVPADPGGRARAGLVAIEDYLATLPEPDLRRPVPDLRRARACPPRGGWRSTTPTCR